MRHAPQRLKAPCVGLRDGLPVGLLAHLEVLARPTH